MTKDPVCGMNIDEKSAVAREERLGTTYYFCSMECHHAFVAHPGKYAKAPAKPYPPTPSAR